MRGAVALLVEGIGPSPGSVAWPANFSCATRACLQFSRRMLTATRIPMTETMDRLLQALVLLLGMRGFAPTIA